MAKGWAQKFYKTKAWHKVREIVMIRDGGMCQGQGCFNPAEEVHHIIHLTEDNITDPYISLNPENLICLCRGCHQKAHARDRVHGLRKKEEKILDDIVFVDGIPKRIGPPH